MKNRIMGELKKVFRPEFLNRIDDVIVFHKLQKDEIKTIVELLLRRIRESMAERELQLELTEEAKDLLVEKGWDPAMGARPLRRAIQRYIEDPLADFVLRAELPPGVEALRAAIPSAIEYALAAIESGEERIGPTPVAIPVQAAASARSEVGLEVVLRRYASGYSTLCDFLHQEVSALGGDSHPGHTVLQRELTAVFDRLVAEVSEAYRREEARAIPSPRQRQTDRIRRLLAGDLVDPAGLDYPLQGSHLAVIATGDEAEAAVGALAKRLDRRALLAEISTRRCIAWLGGARALDAEELDRVLASAPVGLRLSLGEPGEGLAGWRRTRRQAEAAELVGRRSGAALVRYGDVALVAAALRDPDLSHYLTESFVQPLRGDRDTLARTLITFLELSMNASSAAAALGIARQTVASRLQAAEKQLGRPLGPWASQLETALRLAGLGD